MRITAVIPTYNRALLLRRAVESVLAQTYPVSEVIVVDDGSTDNTREVVESFGGRIQYVYQENAGPSAARNNGIRRASGDWIAFLDSDDCWLPDKIRLQVEAVKRNSSAALVYGSAWLILPDGARNLIGAADPKRLWPALRCSNLITSASCVLVRKEVLIRAGGFREDLRVGEDWDLWTKLASRYSFAAVNEPVLNYSVTPNSLSQDPERTVSDMERILETSLLAGLRGTSRVVWRRKIRAVQLYRAALNSRSSNRSASLWLLLRSLAQWPSPMFFPLRWRVLAAHFLGPRSGPPDLEARSFVSRQKPAAAPEPRLPM
ncbi:MAG TPA: glycosyltransferase [Bryobacteraceae bacterium]|nr:glycosyltransferase [Bryobacteraceae bacterium]